LKYGDPAHVGLDRQYAINSLPWAATDRQDLIAQAQFSPISLLQPSSFRAEPLIIDEIQAMMDELGVVGRSRDVANAVL
jgi:hypothetical protein